MKIAIAQEIDQTKPDYVDEEMSLDDDTAVFMQKVFQANITALKDSFQLLNPEDVEKAVQLIHGAERLEFYGSGGSGLIATDAFHKFMRTGINCIVHTDSHFQAMSAGLLDQKSTVLGISHSGRNKDLLDAMKTAKQKERNHWHYKLSAFSIESACRCHAVYINARNGFPNGSDVC